MSIDSEDAANIGRTFLEALPENFCWDLCPTEYVRHLIDERDELQAERDEMREVLLLVFRDTHAPGTTCFSRDTVSMYTAEQVRKVMGIDEKWLERDLREQLKSIEARNVDNADKANP